MAFFRQIFLECAARHPDIEAECVYVDAAGLRLLRAPWTFDVLVTENMFGDILSDVGAALAGGMGMAPSADIGDVHAVFQPCHGTAPDIVGRGMANPTAMFLSAAMMLEWLGERHGVQGCLRAAAALTAAVDAAYAEGTLVTAENGGAAGTVAVADRVLRCLEARVPTPPQPA
jgi:3-isopropylmalate dehydrogenase